MALNTSPYLIIGSGRAAQHFRHYLNYLGLSSLRWSRELEKKPDTEFLSMARTATHILVLISDYAIEPFIESAQETLARAGIDPSTKTWVHFSGSLNTPLAYACHPLMSFTGDRYTLETYRSIAFILDQGTPEFSKLLPKIPNTSYRIDPKKRPLYHALCVLSGNFSALLWQRFFEGLEKDLLIPAEAGKPYLETVSTNIKNNPKTALSGPLVRKDQTTLARNLEALKDDPFENVYRAFVEAYAKIQKGKNP